MQFEVDRLRRSHWLMGGGGIALFLFMFLFKWFGGSVSAPVGSVDIGHSANGWHTFTNSRWIWLITVVLAVGVAVLTGLGRRMNTPVAPGVIVAAFGALSVLLILYRIVHHPSASVDFGSVHASYGIKVGIWLGLIAAGVITYGGYLAMGEEGTTLSDVRDQASRAVQGATRPADSPSGQEPLAHSTAGQSSPPPPTAPPEL